MTAWSATLATCQNIDDFEARNAQPNKIDVLQLHLTGVRCKFPHCGKVYNSGKSIRKHLSERHHCRGKDQEQATKSGIPYQQIFQRRNVYTEVEPLPRPLPPPKPPLEAFITENLQEHEKQQAEQQTKRIIRSATHVTDRTPWLDRTGWPTHLAGLDSRKLMDSARLTGDDEPRIQRACAVTETLLLDCQKKYGPERRPRRVWQILESRKSEEFKDKVGRYMDRDVSYNKSVQGINKKDYRFATPNHYTPRLSAILQIIRRFYCKKVIPDAECDTIEDTIIERLNKYHRKYIQDNTLKPTAYLSDMLPFLSFIQKSVGLDSYASSPFLWITKGQPSKTKSLTDALKKATGELLRAELGTQDWRHVATAIAREKMKANNPLELEFEDESIFNAQAGHIARLDDRYYREV
ncbi:MAG: hypothetical protein Q9170_005984 [Blastenia crenularia]